MTISKLLWSIDVPLPSDQGYPQQLSPAQGPIERHRNAKVTDERSVIIAAVPEKRHRAQVGAANRRHGLGKRCSVCG
jgi:hypothetical protein